MTTLPIFDPIDRSLWGVAIAVFFFGAIRYLSLGLKKEKPEERRLMFGFMFFFIGIGITRIFFLIGDLFLPGTFVGLVYYGSYETLDISFIIITKCGYVSFHSGMALFYYSVKNLLNRMRFVVILLNILFITLIIVLPYDLSKFCHYLITAINIYVIIAIYFLLAKRSHKEFQAVSMMMVMGFILVIIGTVLDASIVKELEISPSFIPPALYVVGCLIYISPTWIGPQYFKQSLLYWATISFFFGSISIWGITSVLNPGLQVAYFIYSFVFELMFILFTVYSIIQTVKIVKSKKSNKSEEEMPNILSLFVRPQRLTEEEVFISKEKKIFLVCKGGIGGINFMCLDCGAFYCHKCYLALSKMENACWACDSSLDESKPVQLDKKKEDAELEIERESYKKGEKK